MFVRLTNLTLRWVAKNNNNKFLFILRFIKVLNYIQLTCCTNHQVLNQAIWSNFPNFDHRHHHNDQLSLTTDNKISNTHRLMAVINLNYFCILAISFWSIFNRFRLCSIFCISWRFYSKFCRLSIALIKTANVCSRAVHACVCVFVCSFSGFAKLISSIIWNGPFSET